MFAGNSTGWMKVAEVDVNNCPSRLRSHALNCVKTCIVNQDTQAATLRYPVHDIQYTAISVRVHAYPIGTLYGFFSLNETKLLGHQRQETTI